MREEQMRNNILAIIFVVLFLLTGKFFIWNNALPQEQTAENPVQDSGFTDMTSTTVTTETTATIISTTMETSATETTVTSETGTTASESTGSTTTALTVMTTTENADSTGETTETSAAAPVEHGVPTNAPEGYFDDALFLGDSRMVGLASFAPIDGATYYATVGLSTYKIDKSTSEVPGTKGQNFQQTLTAKKYGKVYIMLGINEVGNDFSYTINNYRTLIERIRNAQQDAVIYIMSNLHVSANRSMNDKVVNNTVINNFNAELKNLANEVDAYYLDANHLFDDGNGNLNGDYTSDGTHPYAKHYPAWSDWLKSNVIIP
ncbi:MAG: GDSL-type esterase/lipase family protein [Oscillospiraceae bacterium]|nr:GDSL-type esterase/lipase family protein [Oscillospiraceae bacterium]